MFSGLSEYGKQETSTNISAAQLAAEPVFQTAEQSSQLPPTTHPLTVARGSSLHPSVVPLSDPYNMGGSSGTPSLPVSGFHIQPQGSMAAGGRMGMYSGMPSRATIPGGSGYVQQPIQQEVWEHVTQYYVLTSLYFLFYRQGCGLVFWRQQKL